MHGARHTVCYIAFSLVAGCAARSGHRAALKAVEHCDPDAEIETSGQYAAQVDGKTVKVGYVACTSQSTAKSRAAAFTVEGVPAINGGQQTDLSPAATMSDFFKIESTNGNAS